MDPKLSANPTAAGAAPVLLDVRDLAVEFAVHGGKVKAVRNVSFSVREGETLCIVGESGSGKSVTVQTILGLLPSPPAQVVHGEIKFRGQDLLKLSRGELRAIVGGEIAMIFQDPLVSLNPTMTIHDQIAESLILHTKMTKAERRARVLELLDLVRIPEPERRLKQFPHELSGGMRQRIMIAMALACNPKLLIADEPTTALDVTIQAQILSLIDDLAHRFKMATILITHDLGVVAKMADRVAVMYAGELVEENSVDAIFHHTLHPYTLGLRRAMPKEHAAMASEPLQPIPGSPPDLFAPPPGCGFAPRCVAAMKVCSTQRPPTVTAGSARVECWLHHPLAAARRLESGISTLGEASQS